VEIGGEMLELTLATETTSAIAAVLDYDGNWPEALVGDDEAEEALSAFESQLRDGKVCLDQEQMALAYEHLRLLANDRYADDDEFVRAIDSVRDELGWRD
jgi:hypothetical protein